MWSVLRASEGKQKVAVIVFLQFPASAPSLATETKPECATSDHDQGFYSAGWQACRLACFLQPLDFTGFFLAFPTTIFKEEKKDKLLFSSPFPPTCFRL